MSTVITFACIALLAYGVYHYLPPDRPRRLFRIEQFRPAAPLVGILDEERHTGPENGGDLEHATSSAPTRPALPNWTGG